MAQNNKLYQCLYNRARKCDMNNPCNGCKDFAPDAVIPSAFTNNASTKLRKVIIELGCRGVIGASERDTAIVDEICKREGIVL